MTRSHRQISQTALNPPTLSSKHLNWTGMVLEHYIQPACTLPHCEIAWHTLCVVQSHEGNTRVSVNGKQQKYPAKPGELWILPARQTTQSQWDGALEYFRLLIEPQWLISLASDLCGKAGANLNLDLNLQAIDPLIYQSIIALQGELTQHQTVSSLYVETLGQAIALHLLKRYAKLDPSSMDRGIGYRTDFKSVIEYIFDNLSESIQLADLAQVVHMSPNYFAEQFKQVMGISPYRYITQCRIETAQQLLCQKRLSIIEIGIRVGIHNPSHFARLFRQWTGTTPTAYRKLYAFRSPSGRG